MNELYLDYLPDELIYIIITYFNNDSVNSLNSLSENYRKIYNLYVGNIHRGFEFPFKYIIPYNIKLYRFERNKNNFKKTIISTSKYLKYKKYSKYKNEKNIIGWNTNFNSIKYNIKYLIYYKQILNTNKMSLEMEHHELLVIISNINLYTIVEGIEESLSRKFISKILYESYDWEDIWDKLSLEDQNAILYQNDIPIKK